MSSSSKDLFTKPHKPILCVDFDGVIHSYTSGWQGARIIPEPPVKGAIKWLKCLLLKDDFVVNIFSSRSRYFGGRKAMKSYLKKCGLTPEEIKAIKFPTRKPPAFLLIDDRAITFKGIFPDPKELLNFKPWYK
jgi:hypothetical protein